MKGYEKLLKEIGDFFIDDKSKITIGGAIVVFLASIILPFYLIYLKVKYLFVRKRD